MEAQVRRALGNGNDPSLLIITKGERLTVSMVIDRFYEHSRFQGGRKLWQTENRARIEQYIRPALGASGFDELSRDKLYKFYLSMREKGLGRASIHKTHTLLCLIGDLYIEICNEGENPVRRLRDFTKFFPKNAPQREINFLIPEEVTALLKALETETENPLVLPLIQFLAGTGLRRGEALALKWTDIDYKSGFLAVRKSKTGQARNIPLEETALNALKQVKSKHTYVFTYADGTRPHQDSFLKPLQKAARHVGIDKRIDLHTLRHSYGSNKIRSGWGLKKVSMLLGHSEITTTAKVYTHLLDGDLCVRDDFRFDNGAKCANSSELSAADEFVSQVISAAMGKALEGGNDGALDRARAFMDSATEFVKAKTQMQVAQGKCYTGATPG
ncbi:MAG: hypothetical protein A2070_03300 [Bdellovibrionales bacterium GWC1_52_8]|nr:MAG: hypothetical protein A2X97_02170 [Bdellovibrionales bacterium GWA1_52_35]OFZ33619.1 MAG: hypothetical protein A2070_03300 [Bdellovibrionales bacterium GWC1_52_8]